MQKKESVLFAIQILLIKKLVKLFYLDKIRTVIYQIFFSRWCRVQMYS